jgi:hypothetical protein
LPLRPLLTLRSLPLARVGAEQSPQLRRERAPRPTRTVASPAPQGRGTAHRRSLRADSPPKAPQPHRGASPDSPRKLPAKAPVQPERARSRRGLSLQFRRRSATESEVPRSADAPLCARGGREEARPRLRPGSKARWRRGTAPKSAEAGRAIKENQPRPNRPPALCHALQILSPSRSTKGESTLRLKLR